MSTKAFICKEIEKKQYVGVLVNLDGYPTNIGALLLDYYNEPDIIDNLISHGDISCLKEKIEPNPLFEHTENNRQKGVTLFYNGFDKKIKPKYISINDMHGWLAPDYTYVYCLNNLWKVVHREDADSADSFVDLKTEVQKEFLESGIANRPFGLYGFFSYNGKRLPSEEEMIYGDIN